jgi:hypothetical protein
MQVPVGQVEAAPVAEMLLARQVQLIQVAVAAAAWETQTKLVVLVVQD